MKYVVRKMVGNMSVVAYRGTYDRCSWWISTQPRGIHRIELDI